MNNRRYLILIRLALTITLAGPLAQQAGADTISTCIGFIPALPCYNIEVLVPPAMGSSDIEPVPLSGNLIGDDPRGIGSGSAFAFADFNRLGVKDVTTFNSQTPARGIDVTADAFAGFGDSFFWSGSSGNFGLDSISLATPMPRRTRSARALPLGRPCSGSHLRAAAMPLGTFD
jgi:hypothetical protein